jgi:hypothetical protein
MSDIVDELRDLAAAPSKRVIIARAADEIEALRNLIVASVSHERPPFISDGQWARIQSLKTQAERKSRLSLASPDR